MVVGRFVFSFGFMKKGANRWDRSKNLIPYFLFVRINDWGTEVFNDFYANRKAVPSARKTHSEEARANNESAL